MRQDPKGAETAGAAAPAPADRPARLRPAVGFVMATIAIDTLAMGILLPVLPRLLETLTGGNDPVLTARLFGIFGAAWAAAQLLAAPALGALSDRFGRRPVLLVSCFGQIVDFTIMALAPSIAWLMAGRVLSGLSSANTATANAYIADVTGPAERVKAFGLSGLAAASGFMIGPSIGGLLGAVSLRLPFWCAAGLALVNFLFGLVVLRESLPPARRRGIDLRRLSPFSALAMLRRPEVAGPAAIYGTGILAQQALTSVLILFLQDRLHWSGQQVGAALTAAAFGFAVMGGLVVRPVAARLGPLRTLRAGLIGGAAGFVMIGFAWSSLVFWAAIPVVSLWALALPGLQGTVAGHIGASEQGRFQGLLSSLGGLAALVGPLLFTSIYAAGLGQGGDARAWTAGLPFLLGGLLLVVALAITTGRRFVRRAQQAP